MVIGAVEGQSEVDVAKQAGTLVRAYHYVLQYAMAKNALLFRDQYLCSAGNVLKNHGFHRRYGTE